MNTLSVENLGKRYGDTWAVHGIDLTFEPGVIGLLGPNGAGKSTLMRLITTVIEPTEGAVYWNDTDTTKVPQAIRSIVGYLPQSFGVYPNLTAGEFLSYLAAIRGVGNAEARIDDLLELVNLSGAREQRLGEFSGGMRQRVGIAQALLADPDLLVVDEPTVGLDPEERVRFRNVLADLADERIVILSTHVVSDIEATASDIALLYGGEILAHDQPADLLADADGVVWEWVVPQSRTEAIRADYTISSATRGRDGVRVRVVSETAPAPEAESVAPTLEDAYLHAVGGHPRP
ncbi:ABC transporter ATP-binding protein [Halorubrum sp. Ib24]|uniref:ABC transporter ATP-binding protein n=1 Tax=unclassified Halorubrum TaxID=2642239 RepID=UPI000B9809CA|nr:MULTISPECIES: ABC transporter ATP-binding protein [unclassified Halorubrum]OYR40502.1 ABC transporter ATP-binding protein [Halorubrum sp. Ib24]OYR44037.1 ABC transporter ATP-binding protein [Halorubrum sp. Eb13]OYR51442.1 ABC transporter ATP-binding protein [Halorubrum sp. Ea8]